MTIGDRLGMSRRPLGGSATEKDPGRNTDYACDERQAGVSMGGTLEATNERCVLSRAKVCELFALCLVNTAARGCHC